MQSRLYDIVLVERHKSDGGQEWALRVGGSDSITLTIPAYESWIEADVALPRLLGLVSG